MADGVDVPIKLPTDTSGPKAGAAAVKGLLDSLNAMGEAGAKGGKKAQAAVIGVATAAAKAQVAVEKTAAQEAAKAATAQAKAAAKAKNDSAIAAQKHSQRIDADNAKSYHANQAAQQKHAHDIHKKRVDAEIAEEKRAAKESARVHKEAAQATAKAQEKAFADVQKKRVELAKRGNKAEIRQGGGGSGFSIDSLIGSGATAAVAAVAALYAAVGVLAVKFSIAITAVQAFREATLGAFGKLLGGATAANKALQDTVKTADDIGAGYKDTLSSVNSLLAKGFKADMAQQLVKAMADLKSVSPTANITGLLAAIGQIKGKGILQMEELQQQIAEHGLATSVVLEEIGKKIGKSAAEVRKMISAGKISADEGIQGILAAIQKTTGKPIGEAAKESANSLGGLIARLQQVPEGLMMMADASKGVGTVKDVLKNILAAFGPSTESGKALSAAIGKLGDAFGSIFASFSGDSGKKALTGFAEGAAKTIERIAQVVGNFADLFGPSLKGIIEGLGEGMKAGGMLSELGKNPDDMKAMGKALGEIARAIGLLAGKSITGVLDFINKIATGAAAISSFVSFIAGLPGMIGSAIQGAASAVFGKATSIGSNLVAGIIAGITGGMPGLLGVIAQLATTTTAAGQKGYAIKSPSKLWEKKVGLPVKAGEARGIVKGQSLVNSAIAKTAGQSAATAGAGQSAGTQGGGGRSVSIGQIGPFYARTERDAMAIAREVRREIRAFFLEQGFTPALGGA